MKKAFAEGNSLAGRLFYLFVPWENIKIFAWFRRDFPLFCWVEDFDFASYINTL